MQPNEWDTARYPTAFCAKLWGGMPTSTANLWIGKYLYLKPADRKAHVAGATTLLTGRRVLQGAVGVELAPSFRSTILACEAAKAFTDISDDAERGPGELFPGGALTALAAYANGFGVVIKADSMRLDHVFFPQSIRQNRVVLLLLNPIVNHVTEALDAFNREVA